MKTLKEQLNTINELEKFCSTAQWQYPKGSLRDPLDFGIHSETDEIRTWHIAKTTGQFLHFLVTILQPKNILELGTSVGYSALWLGTASQKYGGKIDTLEYFDEGCYYANSLRRQVQYILCIIFLQRDRKCGWYS